MACNKNIVTLPADGEKFKVYTWNDDESDPILFFETTQQGNFSASTIGETFAISGIWIGYIDFGFSGKDI